MVDQSYNDNVGKIVLAGTPPQQLPKKVETATNMYPGRLAVKGSTDAEVVVADAILPPVGWIGYEQMNIFQKKDAKSTILAAGDEAMILKGGGFAINGQLAAGILANEGDALASWSAGSVIAVEELDGGRLAIKIPFSKNTSETDTKVDIPSGMVVSDILIDVTTAVASGTIDVGLLSTESGGDADGFCDGVSCASATTVRPGATVTTGSNEVYISASTRGVFLVDTFTAGSDVATDVGTYEEKIHVGDGTATSVSYTTSNHAIAGNILLVCSSPGFRKVGHAGNTVDNTSGSAVTDIPVESVL